MRRGVRRQDDNPPKLYWAQKVPELKAELLDNYYKLKGWNKDSIPTKESSHELGLDYVTQDFKERGVFTESPVVSIEEDII